jgi:hypothetical protein
LQQRDDEADEEADDEHGRSDQERQHQRVSDEL